MIAKVYRKSLALVLGLSLLNAPLYAAVPFQGSPIPVTPFDSKVFSGGALAADMQAPQMQSAETLFAKAKAFRYVADAPGTDVWQTPRETESRWGGDCEDKALWLYTHLKNNGYQGVRLVIGRHYRSDRNLHVWVAILGESGIQILDPTAQKKIWNASDFTGNEYTPLYSFDGTTRYRHTI